jgi:hypothetical protein
VTIHPSVAYIPSFADRSRNPCQSSLARSRFTNIIALYFSSVSSKLESWFPKSIDNHIAQCDNNSVDFLQLGLLVAVVPGPDIGAKIAWVCRDLGRLRDAPGSGCTAPAGMGIGEPLAQLRAERSGGADGRVYHVGFTATVEHSATCRGAVTVGVPKSRSEWQPVDGGALYDSTAAFFAASAANCSPLAFRSHVALQ